MQTFTQKKRTVLISGTFDLRQKTRMVDRITDDNGAAAETQKSFGFLMLCIHQQKVMLVRQSTGRQAKTYERQQALTIRLVASNKTKKPTPITMVCQFH